MVERGKSPGHSGSSAETPQKQRHIVPAQQSDEAHLVKNQLTFDGAVLYSSRWLV